MSTGQGADRPARGQRGTGRPAQGSGAQRSGGQSSGGPRSGGQGGGPRSGASSSRGQSAGGYGSGGQGSGGYGSGSGARSGGYGSGTGGQASGGPGARSGGYGSGTQRSGGYGSGAPSSGGQGYGYGSGSGGQGAARSGDPRGGGPRSSDPRSGDPRSGDSRSGDSRSGGSRSGAPRVAGSRPGTSGGGDPRSAGTRSGSRPGAPRPPARRRAPAPVEPLPDVHVEGGVRLQKVLATAGLGSRRACEDLITAGRVTVDGIPVHELGVRVDPATAAIHVDGMRIQLDTSVITLALNKPLGVVSTMHDPEGRPSLAQFVANREERLFHVGRLDAETEGLLLLTNDGELANRLAHPSHEVAKTYLAHVEGRVPPSVGQAMLRGIELDDGVAKVDKYRVVDSTPNAALVEIVLHEGRNRIVRRLFEAVGHPVDRLVRTQIGPIRLGDLKPGRTRVLSQPEVGSLMTQVGM